MCANNTVRLSVATAMKADFKNVLEYVWEYNIGDEQEDYWIPNPSYCGDSPVCDGGGGPIEAFQSQAAQARGVLTPLNIEPGGEVPACCYESAGSWGQQTKWTTLTRTYGNNDNGTLTLNLLTLTKIANLTTNSNVTFRVTTVAHGISATSQGSRTISLSPRAPELTTVQELQSCPNSSTGSIKVSGIKGSGLYQYTIRTGHGNNLPCTPVVGCLTGIKSGSITGASGDITAVPGGEYTLWISNNGGTSGVCSSTRDITIPTITALTITQQVPKKDASCNAYTDGEIKLGYTGGAAPYTYSLTDNSSNATGVFSGLKAGTYTANVTDGCSQVNTNTTQQIIIAEPKSIQASASGGTLTCNSPADGVAVATITDGPGMYNYYLKQGTTVVTQVESTAITSWNVSGQASGSYTLEIVDAQRTSCPGYSTTVSMAAPSVLTIATENFQVKDVSCNDGGDGKVTLSGLDMSGKYNYTLTRSTDNTAYSTSTDVAFASLRGDSYTLAMTRSIEGCNDIYTYPSAVVVSQPSAVGIEVNKQDISCYGLTDGKVTVVPSGGSGSGYTYTWEQFIGSSWSTMGSVINAISNRAEGTYRVRVKDSKLCAGVTDPIDIVEPAKLIIIPPVVKDIMCYGEKGYIEMTTSGGTGAITYQYTTGQPYQIFTNTTPLSAGSYTVRAVDANSCSTTYGTALTLTAPATALDFTATKSDYSGVNISCFGGSNGYVTLVGTGGNGSSYSGYQYALDGGPYQEASRLDGINAGDHLVYVRDARGCILSRTLGFTQSSDPLAFTVVEKKDVTCFGDLTGVLQISGAGGVGPYTYSLDNGAAQTQGRFTGLGTGVHAIKLFDRNNCDNTYSYEIVSVNPVMQISPEVHDAQCFQAADGQIALTVAGGVAPFTYSWNGYSTGGALLSNVRSGEYNGVVTDNAGCRMSFAATVDQPAQVLRIGVSTVPVCYGSTNGVISIQALGGTGPYRYSIDDGVTFQTTGLFNTVGVGNYPIRVKDDHACFTTTSAVIIQRNDKPEPDFIVATKGSALDTLVITEISVPKPDSVYWLFDATALVLDNDSWHPKIKFDNEGSYDIGMTGYFGGCAYSVNRTLTINAYDPEVVKTRLPEYKAISSVEATPNPTSGTFTVTVKLNYKHSLSMVVYDVIGGIHYHNSWGEVDGLTETITLDGVAPGVYLLRVVTPSDAQDVRILINK
jgi:hypothetical protein